MKQVNSITQLEQGVIQECQRNMHYIFVSAFTAHPSCAICKAAELQPAPHHGITQTGGAQSHLFAWSDVVSISCLYFCLWEQKVAQTSVKENLR